MADKKFLEEYPLYKKFKSDLRYYHSNFSGISESNIPKPAIHMHCDICNSAQTFNMSNEYYCSTLRPDNINGKVKKIDYVCSACEKGSIYFMVYFSQEKIDDSETQIIFEKVGQIPAWSINIDKELGQILGDYKEYYKRGLICESQGYGVGAFAYFRRIVESIIDELLDSIVPLLKEEDLGKYKKALEETKKTRVAQEKIDLVKDLIPTSLRPNDMNPLGILHSSLSEGLHTKTDEGCLELADAVRKSLTFLIKRILKEKDENKYFADSMKKFLEKKNKKKTKK